MTLPGSTVTVRNSAPPRSAPTDSSVWFVTGFAEKGAAGVAQLLHSMADYATVFGARVTYGLLYDALDVFFREGGSKAYVSRAVGPTPVKATHTFLDAVPANSLIVTAKTYGDWANGLSIAITHPDGTHYVLAISLNGTLVETSPSFTTQQAAVDWSASTSQYVDITLGAGTAIPVAATASLAGGTDDHANATETQWETALAAFGANLGPGQVSAPGRSTDQAHIDLLTHAATFNRVALVDFADTATVATLTAAAVAARNNGAKGGGFAPWAVVPGVVPSTTRTVPYSAVEAGIMARNDSAGESPNVPAAGLENGVAQYAIALSQAAWKDADRETLNNAGVNVAQIMLGAVTSFGYRTLADPTTATDSDLMLSNARLLMEIVAKLDAVGDRHAFREIDGRGLELGEFAADLGAELLPYWNEGSLFGATSGDAFDVDVGPQVNTPTTIAARQLNAQVTLTMSPFAEVVLIYITKEAVS